MIKKSIFAILCLLATQISNAQSSYFNQDPCMQQLMQNGCTEVFENLTIFDPILDNKCPGMRVKITLSKLICNGNVVSIHIWSSGTWAPPTGPCSYSMSDQNDPAWPDFRNTMRTQIEFQVNQLITSLGLSSVLVSTGSVCKADVTFTMPPYTVMENVRTVCSTVWIPPTVWNGNTIPGYWQDVYCPGEGTPTPVVKPGGNFAFTIPCQSELCCFGYAQVVNGKIVGVTPAPNPSAPDCPTPLTTAEIQDWFTQTFQVTGGGASNMTNITISPCQEDCDLERLAGRSTKSTGNISTGKKIDYNITIASMKETSLTFKSDILPSSYQILDINGKLLDKRIIQSNIIDTKSLSKGIYFLKVNFDNGISSVVKFVKD